MTRPVCGYPDGMGNLNEIPKECYGCSIPFGEDGDGPLWWCEWLQRVEEEED